MAIKININGDERTKNEIVYNNIVNMMDEMNISKTDQIEYLKEKLSFQEEEIKNTISIFATILIGLTFLLFGIYLILVNLKITSIIFILIGFLITNIKLCLVIKKNVDKLYNNKLDQVDQIKKILDSRLK